MTVYEYAVKDPSGKEVSLKKFEGKVLMIVNTATGCGFTPQYKDLEDMYEKYNQRGLEILDIPCNQFAGQTPGTDEEIHDFCQLHYHTLFAQMTKSEVNGANQLPLYAYLKSQQGFRGFSGPKAPLMDEMLAKIDPGYRSSPDIKWNFTKFIVDRTGRVAARFEPTADMSEVEAFVASLL